MPATWTNWSGGVACRPASVHYPRDEADLRRIVAACGPDDTLRVAGTGHSFTPLVATDDVLVSLERYTGLVEVDERAGTATVRAGTPIAELTPRLAEHGLAMANMGDVDRQTVAGAIATGTHGTGIDFGVLSTQVSGLRLLDAAGTAHDLDPTDGDRFRAALVSLGALGVVSTVTLDLEPQYSLRAVERPRDVEAVLADLPALCERHRNVEFFWFPHTDTALLKTLDVTDDPPTGGGDLGETLENAYWEAACRVGTRVPALRGRLNRLTTRLFDESVQVGPSHRVYPTAREVRFEETEHAVPAADGIEAFRDVRRYVEREGRDVMFPVEFRYVAGDDIPLSPAYGRDSAFIAVHTYHRTSPEDFFDGIYELFDADDARPHWGKRHDLTASSLAPRYPEWDTFQSARAAFDPEGLFCNDHVREVLGPPPAST